MRKIYKLILFVLFIFSVSVTSFAQNRFFSFAGENANRTTSGKREIFPGKFAGFTTDIASLRNFLWTLPSENSINANRNLAPVLEIPMPNGSFAKFRVWESSIMAPELAVKFPEMRQFLGQGIDDPYATIRFDYNPYTGFHAQILSSVNGRVFIDPYAKGDVNYYMSYKVKDYSSSESWICEVVETSLKTQVANRIEAACLGTSLRTYRLALACTGEYAVAVCSPNPASVPLTAAAMLTSVNRVSGVYETEVSVRMQLVANNNNLIYLDGATDPYTNNNGATMLGQNQANIDAIIGSANYDIGHVFSTGGGGIAGLGVVCINGQKARGVTGSSSPVGDAFDIDYVAHEMGHQYSGNHSMAGCGSSPNSTKYEVGSGTTIQAYAGICGAENIQPNSDPFFHAISFDEISNFVNGTGGSCAVLTPTGNTLPVIDPLPNNGVTIPISTPFTLSGTATDANGDPLTYCWEQWDIGGGSFYNWNAGASAAAGNTVPLFKSRVPKTNGVRTFPDIAVILAGYPAVPAATMGGLKGETLSPVARPMNFRLTVRDNRAGGGGVSSSGGGGCQTSTAFTINVAGTAPFVVTAPNGGESFPGGSTQTVTWNVVGTNAAPFNVANVKISYSTDGGLTYPTVLLASTANDGSESVVIPAGVTTTARVKVEAISNIFFDISNANFTVTAPVNGYTFGTATAGTASCPAAGPINGSVPVNFQGTYTGPVTVTYLSGAPAGTTVNVSPSSFTANGTAIVSLSGTGALASGTYNVTVQGTGPAPGTTQTVVIPFTINPGTGPSITTQPINQTVCEGVTANFSVVATGVASYQWQFSSNGGATFNNIGGTNTAAYSFPGAVVGNNGWQFRCVLTGQCGTTNTNAAILTVNTAPSVTAQPQDITLCTGANHTFSVTATGSGLTYQWQLSTDAGATYNNIGSATNNTYTLSGITIGMNGYRYRCVVSGSCPPSPVNSNGAILTVQAPVLVTGNPANQVICNGDNASFTVAGSGSGIIYQWQVNNGSGFINVTNGGVYSGATTTTLVITGTNLSLNGYQYRCQLTSIICTTPATSSAATLTVNSLPAVTSSPANQTICSGSSTTFSVSGTGTGIVYQWQVNSGSGFTNISNGGVYSGATSATLTLTGATTALNGYQYRCFVSGTCPPAANSAAATLTVIAPVSLTASPADAVLCSGNNTTFTVTGTSTLTINYQWQINTGSGFTNISNGGVYSGATTPALAITGATTSMSSYQYRCLLSNVTCTTPTISGTALLTVRQTPTVTLSVAPLTSLLPGQTTTLTAVPSAQTLGTLTTSWTYNSNAVSNTGNTRVVNVEKVGSYRVSIQEVFTSPAITCSNQSAVVTIDALISDKLFIFPSPNDGNFTISYYNNGGTSTTRTIVIFDSKGAQVYNGKFPVTGAYTLIPINLQKGSRGIYYVVVGDVTGKKLAEGRVHVR